MKGYDASNIRDEEFPTERLVYSDNNAEAAAKSVKRRGSSNAGGVDGDGIAGASGVRHKRPSDRPSRGGRYHGKGDIIPRGHRGAGYQDSRWRSVRNEHHSLFQNQVATPRPNPVGSGEESARARMTYRSSSLSAGDDRRRVDASRGIAPVLSSRWGGDSVDTPMWHNSSFVISKL
jgi:hypothetical protein